MNEAAEVGASERLRMLRRLWVGLVAGVFVYGLLATVLAGQAELLQGLPWPPPALRAILPALAVLLAIVSMWWRRSLATWPRSPLYLFVRETLPREMRREAEALAAQRLATNAMVVWGMCDGIAVIGLALALLGRDPTLFFPFGLLAAVLLHLHRPAAWPLARIFGHPTGT